MILITGQSKGGRRERKWEEEKNVRIGFSKGKIGLIKVNKLINLISEPNTGKMQDMKRHGVTGILREKNTGIQTNRTKLKEITVTKTMMTVTTWERNLPELREEEKYDGNDNDDDAFKRKREYSTKTKFNQKMNNDKKQRGERFAKKEKKQRSYKKNNGKYRGETNQWDYDDDEDDNHYNSYQVNEEVHYAERHYNDESGKNRHEKRAKRKFSKRENDKKFVIEADFEQFY